MESDNVDNELKRMRDKRIRELMGKDSNNSRDNKSEFPDKPLQLTDANFNEFIAKYKLIFVDCWAPWCGPCKMIGPIIDRLASKYKGKVVFGKLNVDDNQRTAARFQISGIPTMLIFRDGRPVDRITGALPQQSLEQRISKYLKMEG